MTEAVTAPPSESRARIGMDRCVELMAAGKWESGRTAPELAKEFGVTKSAVENWSAAASWHLSRLAESEQDVELVRGAMRGIVKGDTKREQVTGDGEVVETVPTPGDKTSSGQLLLKSHGLLRDKVDHTHRVAGYDEGTHLLRIRELLREPDPVTAKALALEGYERRVQLDAHGEESPE